MLAILLHTEKRDSESPKDVIAVKAGGCGSGVELNETTTEKEVYASSKTIPSTLQTISISVFPNKILP